MVWNEIKQSIASCETITPHIPIHNAISCLTNCLAFGRGLDGLHLKQATEIIFEYLVTRCQAVMRGMKNRKAMQSAKQMWKRKDMVLKNLILGTWSRWCRTRVTSYRCLYWVFRKWKCIKKIRFIKRQYFCSCFWPWYTWRRHVILNQKLRMLKNLWIQCIRINFFRRWKASTQQLMNTKNKIHFLKTKVAIKIKKNTIAAWYRYQKQKKCELFSILCC